MSLPRMRTAAGVLELIRQEDPGTQVTEHYIRKLIKTGKVPVTEIGAKKLVDADKVIEYIASGGGNTAEVTPRTGQIRRVAI